MAHRGDELSEELRVLGGYDDDLAHDGIRVADRLRDMLPHASPNVELVLGHGSIVRPSGRS